MLTAIIMYLFIVVFTMLTSNKISVNPSKRINSLIYGGTGGVVGGVSHWFLNGSKGIMSLLENSMNGNFGYAGYYFFASISTLVLVWSWNFWKHDGVAIR